MMNWNDVLTGWRSAELPATLGFENSRPNAGADGNL